MFEIVAIDTSLSELAANAEIPAEKRLQLGSRFRFVRLEGNLTKKEQRAPDGIKPSGKFAKMVDKSEKLKAALTELHTELEQVDTVDPELRQMLVGTMSDINKALESRGTEEPIEHDESLSGRLTESIKDFEESHPNIAGIVQRMVDVLSQMGI